MKIIGPSFFIIGRDFITVLVSLPVIGLLRIFIQSWLDFGNSYMSQS